jgi:hypothetical protein
MRRKASHYHVWKRKRRGNSMEQVLWEAKRLDDCMNWRNKMKTIVLTTILALLLVSPHLSCITDIGSGGQTCPQCQSDTVWIDTGSIMIDTIWRDTGSVVHDTTYDSIQYQVVVHDTMYDSIPYPVVVHDTVLYQVVVHDTVFVYDTIIDSIPYHVMVHDTTRDTIERVITHVDSAYFYREVTYPLYIDRESFRKLAGYPINSGDSVEYWGLDALAPDTIIRKNIRGGTYKVIMIDTVYQVVVRR